MLQIEQLNWKRAGGAAFLGLIGAFLIFLAESSQIKVALYFSNLPIFIAYLVYGRESGGVSAVVLAIMLFLIAPLEVSCDVLLSTIAPAAVLGHLSVKSITQGRKTWWYPETFLLQNFILLYFFVLIFLSIVSYPEDYCARITQRMLKKLCPQDGPNTIFMRQYLFASYQYTVGMLTLYKMIITLLIFALVHRVTKMVKKNIRPSFDLKHLTIHYSIAIFPLIFLTLGKIFHGLSFICSGLFLVGLFAPAVSGFSVIYRLAGGKVRTLLVFHISLLVVTVPTIVIVILIGVIDSFRSSSELGAPLR
ncbi:MAG: hypothetical protein LBB25_04360 [Holosporaceae bacterium]|jgi:hypothetical protein|nr:hypothetical protein [Holosporaceae bacterium]